MLKVLLTGGAGFIGSQVAQAYLNEGHQVTIVDNLSSGFQENLPQAAQFVQMDVQDPQLAELFAEQQFDIINHHAAQIDVRISIEKPIEDAKVNVLGALNLLECARKYGLKKFIYASTGGAIHGNPESLPAKEGDPIKPICHYGVSKHAFEHYLFLYRHLYDLPFTILRYPNVYGPRQNPFGEAGVNAIFVGKMLQGQVPTIYGDGQQLRDYTFVGDIVRANLMAIDPQKQGIVNICTGQGRSVNEIYEILQKIIAFEPKANYAPKRLGEIDRVYLDPQLAQNEWGFKAEHSLEQGLAATVQWFEQEGIERFFGVKVGERV